MANVSDTKKVQSFVNILANEIITIRASIQTMKDVSDLYTIDNPSTASTCIQGKKAEISTALSDLDTLVNTTSSSTWDIVVNCLVPSHRGEAFN